MKRFWIGLGLLMGLLAAGLWAMAAMDAVHGSISDDLRRSAQAAQYADWAQADTLAASAAAEWDDHWRFSASMADHTSLDEIDALFAQSEVYRQARHAADYAAACARLAQLIDALEEGHKLSWWNLL